MISAGHGVLSLGFTKYSVWKAWPKIRSVARTATVCQGFIVICVCGLNECNRTTVYTKYHKLC